MSSDDQTSEIESIAAELRAAIRQARVVGSSALGGHALDGAARPEPQIEPDLQIMRSTYDIASAPFTSHRRILGPFIIPIKNFARELLVQLLARQSVYNGAAARAIAHLSHRLNSLADENARLAQRLAALETDMESGRMTVGQAREPADLQRMVGLENRGPEDVRAGASPPSISGGHKRGARGRA